MAYHVPEKQTLKIGLLQPDVGNSDFLHHIQHPLFPPTPEGLLLPLNPHPCIQLHPNIDMTDD